MMTDRKSKLAVIHIARKQCGLDEQSYRALLSGAAGIESAAELKTDAQYRSILSAFEKLGFRNGKKGRYKVRDGQMAKCYAIWTDLHKLGAVRDRRYGAMMSWIKRMLGSDQDIFRKDQKSLVIEELKNWRDRVEGNDDRECTGNG